MSFRNSVLNIYETTSSAPWKEDLAHTLFADQVASQLENFHASEGDDEAHFIAEDLSHEVHPQGGDITEAVLSLAQKESLDLRKYYDIDQIDKMDQALRKTLHITLEDVYNENPHWAHSIALGFVGHGVSPFDDKEFQSWLQYQSGATELDWRRHPHFESPYGGALEFIDQVIEQRRGAGEEEEKQKEEEEEVYSYTYPHTHYAAFNDEDHTYPDEEDDSEGPEYF